MSDALADPIVQALMAADRIDASSVAALMQRIAVRLRRRPRKRATLTPLAGKVLATE